VGAWASIPNSNIFSISFFFFFFKYYFELSILFYCFLKPPRTKREKILKNEYVNYSVCLGIVNQKTKTKNVKFGSYLKKKNKKNLARVSLLDLEEEARFCSV
jgi:hypothetical protein